MSVPLKLKDSAAPTDLQVMTDAEQNYLAYQVGLGLAALDSTGVGRLGIITDGTNPSLGEFFDTSYDSAVGTQSALLTLTTVGSQIWQKVGTETMSGNDYRIPVTQRDSDGQRVIQEMNTSDLNTLLDRINSRIHTSDYPGTYKLATSAPSGDYAVELSGITTDTRSDGTSTAYNLYKRTTMTAPTTVRPFAIKRSNGDSGSYQGLMVMTDNQIKNSLGMKMRNRTMADSDGIGTYKILSSAQGNPTSAGFSGTWQSKGSATDTRQVTTAQNYTRDRTSTYTRLRSSTYSASYERTRSSNYTSDSTTVRQSNYTSTYTKTRTSTYSPAFVGDFIGDYSRTRITDYTRTRTSTLNYQSTSSGNYVGDYTRNVNYSRNFTGDYIGVSTTTERYNGSNYWRITHDYYGTYADISVYWNGVEVYYNRRQPPSNAYTVTASGIYRRGSSQGGYSYTSNYAVYTETSETYSANYARNYAGSVTYQGNYSRNFLGDYTRVGSYQGDYTGNFLGDYLAESQRVTASGFSRDFLGDYSRSFDRDRNTNYARNYIGNYARNFARNFLGDYIDNYTGNFTGNYVGGSTTGPSYSTNPKTVWIRMELDPEEQDHDYLVRVYWGGGLVYQQYGNSTIGNATSVTGTDGKTYTRGGGQTGGGINEPYPASSSYSVNYYSVTQTSTADYIRTRVTDYTRISLENYARNYAGDFQGDYSRNFLGDYTGDYSRNYEGTRSSNYAGAAAFSRDFAGNYIGDFTRDFNAAYTGDYSTNFAGNYLGNYSREFLGNYSRTFTGNYGGTSIDAGGTNIETYTMYVRIA